MGEKAGIWLRVSTRGQSEENQIPDVTGWVAAHGYEVARTYQLHGRSAYKGEQAETLAEMLDDMRHGRITVLVVWKSDRIERRGPRFVFDLAGQVADAGGRIEFVTETYLNDLNAAGEMMLANMAIMAREESRTKSDRIQSGLNAARTNGAATNRPPWGLRSTGPKRGKTFVPTALGRKWVPEVFQRVAAGQSITEVARFLTASRVGDKHWYPSTVATMLRNPAYRGTVVSGGEITHRCEALVDAALWQRANVAAGSPERYKRGPGQPRAMLAGVARCGECGGTVYRTAASRGRQTRYYRCVKAHGLMVPTARVEAAVNHGLGDWLGLSRVTRDVLVPGQNWDKEIEDVKFELRHLDPDAEDYDDLHAKLRAELASLKARPSVPDRWETEETGQTYASEWAELPEDRRAQWLKKNRFLVLLHRDRVAIHRDYPRGPWVEVPIA